MEGVMNCLYRLVNFCLLDNERNIQLRRALSNGDNVDVGIGNGGESLSRDPAHALHSLSDNGDDGDVFLEFDVVNDFLLDVDLEFIPKLLQAFSAIFLRDDNADIVLGRSLRNHHHIYSNASERREYSRGDPGNSDHAIPFDRNEAQIVDGRNVFHKPFNRLCGLRNQRPRM